MSGDVFCGHCLADGAVAFHAERSHAGIMRARATAPARAAARALPGKQIKPLKPGSAPWLRLMTGSKMAAVVGLSPWESPFSLWHRMAGAIDGQADSAILRRGHYLEPAILRWLADQHPDWTLLPGGMWQHPDDSRFAASPDAMAWSPTDGMRCIEAKTAANDEHWGRPGSDEIPVGYKVQVMWEMACSGARTTHIAVLTSRLAFAEYVIDYDADEVAFLYDKAWDFLASLPGGGAEVRPDIDSHDSTYQAVRHLHPDVDGQDVEIDRDLAAAYCSARHDLARAEAEATRTKSLLADALGTGKRARFQDQTIARRQAKGDGIPFIVAGKSLPTFTEAAAA